MLLWEKNSRPLEKWKHCCIFWLPMCLHGAFVCNERGFDACVLVLQAGPRRRWPRRRSCASSTRAASCTATWPSAPSGCPLARPPSCTSSHEKIFPSQTHKVGTHSKPTTPNLQMRPIHQINFYTINLFINICLVVIYFFQSKAKIGVLVLKFEAKTLVFKEPSQTD